MNRGVLDRQMFKKGGAVFPDLSGDGKVTRKDILMGRGVLPMQEGGMVPVDGMPMPAGLPAAAAQPSAAQGPDQIDPAMMEQMLQQASTQFADIDEAGDYEEMMNAIRGDQQSIGERRQELASLVGQEDAQETPESVLTLLQPVMQIAAVEQGIGGLAEDAMGSAVEGPMAGGIMSTVNMGGPAPAAPGPAMPMEGGAPVQAFRYGGAVRMAEGGNPFMERTQELMPEYQQFYRGVLGGTPAEDLAEQRRLTQAQALFDIAQAGFAFAQPGSRRQSPVSRLGEAITETQLFPKIGARAAELKGFEREQERQQRALDLSALQGAMGQTERERAAAAAEAAEGRQFTRDLYRDALEAAREREEAERQFKRDKELEELKLGGQEPDFYSLTMPGEGAKTVNALTPEGRAEIALAEKTPGARVERIGTAKTPSVLENPEFIAKYGSGELEGRQLTAFETALVEQLAPQTFLNQQGQSVTVAGTVTPSVLAALKKRHKNKLPTPNPNLWAQANLNDEAALEAFNFDPASLAAETGTRVQVVDDLTQVYGFGSTLGRATNFFLGQLGELPAIPEGMTAGKFLGSEAISKLDPALEQIANRTMSIARDERNGRIFALDVDNLAKEVQNIRPGGRTTDAKALDTFRALRTTLMQQFARTQGIIQGSFSPDLKEDARLAQLDLAPLIADYTAAINSLENYLGGGSPVEKAASVGTRTSYTSSLPRAGTK